MLICWTQWRIIMELGYCSSDIFRFEDSSTRDFHIVWLVMAPSKLVNLELIGNFIIMFIFLMFFLWHTGMLYWFGIRNCRTYVRFIHSSIHFPRMLKLTLWASITFLCKGTMDHKTGTTESQKRHWCINKMDGWRILSCRNIKEAWHNSMVQGWTLL